MEDEEWNLPATKLFFIIVVNIDFFFLSRFSHFFFLFASSSAFPIFVSFIRRSECFYQEAASSRTSFVVVGLIPQ